MLLGFEMLRNFLWSHRADVGLTTTGFCEATRQNSGVSVMSEPRTLKHSSSLNHPKSSGINRPGMTVNEQARFMYCSDISGLFHRSEVRFWPPVVADRRNTKRAM